MEEETINSVVRELRPLKEESVKKGKSYSSNFNILSFLNLTWLTFSCPTSSYDKHKKLRLLLQQLATHTDMYSYNDYHGWICITLQSVSGPRHGISFGSV